MITQTKSNEELGVFSCSFSLFQISDYIYLWGPPACITTEKLNIASRKTQRPVIVGSFPHLSPQFQKVSVDSVDCSVF